MMEYGSGKFVVPDLGVKIRRVQRKARMARNPITGEPISVPAKTAVKATVLKALKDAVKQSGDLQGLSKPLDVTDTGPISIVITSPGGRPRRRLRFRSSCGRKLPDLGAQPISERLVPTALGVGDYLLLELCERAKHGEAVFHR